MSAYSLQFKMLHVQVPLHVPTQQTMYATQVVTNAKVQWPDYLFDL